MEQVNNRLAMLMKSSRSLNVPMGKGDNKMQTLLDLVLDLRLDNEQLQQENAYLRQLLQDLEGNPGLVDELFTTAVDKPSAKSGQESTANGWDETPEGGTFDWEALYFEPRSALEKGIHVPYDATQGNGQNGHQRQNSQNGQHHGRAIAFKHQDSAVAEDRDNFFDASQKNKAEIESERTTVESISLEQLMAEILEPQQDKPASLRAAKSAPVPEAREAEDVGQTAFDAILRDPVSGHRLADVVLQGSLISSRDLAGNQRRVWGFQLVQGSVQAEWRRGKHLYLCLKNGTAVRVRVAGLPSDESNNGYVELV